MTYQDINKTIALHLGWVEAYNDFGWFGWKKGHHSIPECPDYQGSLDLCREFEQILTEDQRRIYLNYITNQVHQPDQPID